MDKTDEAAGSAIAAFTLAQFAFWHQIQSGSLPVENAAQMLKQGVEANAKGSAANQKAAQILQTVLDMVTRDQRPRSN